MSVNWSKTITTTIANILPICKDNRQPELIIIQPELTIFNWQWQSIMSLKTFRILDWFELAALYNQKVMLNVDDEEGQKKMKKENAVVV